ncbi:MAG: molybdopterin-dependent oxidoreductase [Vibrio sp.]
MKTRFSQGRRSFLKGASLVGGSALFMSTATLAQSLSTSNSTLTVSSAVFMGEKRVPVMCRMCAQTCPAFAVVKNGEVIRIENNPVNKYAGVCGRGRAGLAALYSEDRIKTPLIRTGERGEGQFRPATWNEALDRVAASIKKLQDNNQIENLYYFYRYSSAPMFDKSFFHLLGTNNIVDYADTCWKSTAFAQQMVFGKGGAGAFTSDWEHSKYGVMIGKNPGGAVIGYGWSKLFANAQKNGVPFTIVDPRRPNELGQSYAEWQPIRPGTDSSFLMAVMQTLVKANKVNWASLAEKTNADMLVNAETFAPIDATPNYYVFDKQAQQIVNKADAKESEFNGEWDFNGQKVTTAWAAWSQSLLALSMDELTKECGIKQEQVESIANRLADAMPQCFVEVGYRFARHSSDLRSQLAALQLNLLLGTFGEKGGILVNKNAELGAPLIAPPSSAQSFTKWFNQNETDSWGVNTESHRALVANAYHQDIPMKPEMIFLWGNNLLGGATGGADIAAMLKGVSDVVAVSPFWNDTLMFADVILPDCTYLERDELLGADYKTLVPVVGVHKKAIDPLHDSKPGYWILTELAKRVFSDSDYQTYFADIAENGLDGAKRKQLAGIQGITDEERKTLPTSLEALEEAGGWSGFETKHPLVAATPTQRYEIFSTQLFNFWSSMKADAPDYAYIDHASPLNVQLPPRWIADHGEVKGNEFIPVTGFSPLGSFTGAQAKDNAILHFLQNETHFSSVFINTKRANELGLKSGDKVAVWSKDDKSDQQIATVEPRQTIHPDVIFSYFCAGKGLYGPDNKFTFAPQDGINPNQFGHTRLAPGVKTHTPQDVVLKIERIHA